MFIKVDWDNPEKSIIRVKMAQQWSNESFYAAVDQIGKMLEGIHHRVDVIYMDCSGGTIPLDNPFRHFQRVDRLIERPKGLNILVIPDPSTRAIMAAYRNMPGVEVPKTLRMVRTMDEAYALILHTKSMRSG